MNEQTLFALLKDGLDAHNQQDYAKAQHCYEKVIEQDKGNANAFHLLGLTYLEKGDYATAQKKISYAIELSPLCPAYYLNLASVEIHLEQYQAAEKTLKHALSLNPEFPDAMIKLGYVYQMLNLPQQAGESFEKALHINPHSIDALVGQGIHYEQQKNYNLALSYYERALAVDARDPFLLNNLANLYHRLGQSQQAEELFSRLLELEPNFIHGHQNYGRLLYSQGQIDQAIYHFERVLGLNPRGLRAHLNLGDAFAAKQQHSEAQHHYEQAMQPNSDYQSDPLVSRDHLQHKAMIGHYLMQLKLCHFDYVNKHQALVKEIINENLASQDPPLISPLDAILLQGQVSYEAVCAKNAQVYDEFNFEGAKPLVNLKKQSKPYKIAYLSPDLKDHSVGILLQQLLPFHQREDFIVYGIQLNAEEDRCTHHLREMTDGWLDIHALSDTAAFKAIRELELDIVIDCGGYTKGARPRLIYHRLAPLQFIWLGQLEGMGLENIDYLITTPYLTPESLAKQYKERLFYLPQTIFAINKEHHAFSWPEVIPKRSTYGLPEDKVVYACFNQSMRIDEGLFTTWLAILQQVPNSVLWLAYPEEKVKENLKAAAQKANIDHHRIIFKPAGKVNEDWHQRLADIYLDTPNESSGVLSMYALLAGVPIVTCPGFEPRSRLAATFNICLKQPKLNATSIKLYEQIAIKLGLDKIKRQQISTEILSNLQTSVLLNPKILVNQFEQGLLKAIQQASKQKSSKLLYATEEHQNA